MEADLTQITQILRREYLFEGLETDQLVHIAESFEPVEYKRGQIVFAEGDEPGYFYLIMDGRVRLTRRVNGKTRLINYLGPGDYFGEMALLFRHRRSATAVATGSTTLLCLSPNKFANLLNEFPKIRSNLSATAESRRLVRSIRFDWLGPDEVIYYVARKHRFFLFLKMLPPASLLVIGTLLLVMFFLPAELSLFSVLLILAMILASVSWGVWNWIDWSNDYYIVTSQRVVWQEKIVALYDSRREAPLDAVMAVNVSSDQIGRLLNYGNVDVRTFTGSLLMHRMDQPNRFASFVEGYKKRVIAFSKEQLKQDMETDLHQALFPGEPPPEKAEPPVLKVPLPSPKKKPKQKSVIEQILHTFLKVRYEEGGIITYRKHWFVLLGKSWPSLLSITGYILALYLVLRFDVIRPLTACFSAPLFLVLLSWLVYQYLDWNNDIYRLTPEQILDIEKKPLGREVKKSAGLDAPDFRVEHTRANILNILLNFGTVTINIGQTQFIFYGVYNPDQVHKEVSDYREALIRRKRQAEDKRDRDRMVDWLVTYYQQTGKLEDHENPAGADGNSR